MTKTKIQPKNKYHQKNNTPPPAPTPTPTDSNSNICIIKTSVCKTLSSKSSLDYHIGTDNKDSLFFKVSSNTGGGYFNKEWVAYKEIQTYFEKWPDKLPITAVALVDLFKGKSANSPAFLLAILKHEQIIKPMEGMKRHHKHVGDKTFLAEMKKLTSTNLPT